MSIPPIIYIECIKEECMLIKGKFYNILRINIYTFVNNFLRVYLLILNVNSDEALITFQGY